MLFQLFSFSGSEQPNEQTTLGERADNAKLSEDSGESFSDFLVFLTTESDESSTGNAPPLLMEDIEEKGLDLMVSRNEDPRWRLAEKTLFYTKMTNEGNKPVPFDFDPNVKLEGWMNTTEPSAANVTAEIPALKSEKPIDSKNIFRVRESPRESHSSVSGQIESGFSGGISRGTVRVLEISEKVATIAPKPTEDGIRRENQPIPRALETKSIDPDRESEPKMALTLAQGVEVDEDGEHFIRPKRVAVQTPSIERAQTEPGLRTPPETPEKSTPGQASGGMDSGSISVPSRPNMTDGLDQSPRLLSAIPEPTSSHARLNAMVAEPVKSDQSLISRHLEQGPTSPLLATARVPPEVTASKTSETARGFHEPTILPSVKQKLDQAPISAANIERAAISQLPGSVGLSPIGRSDTSAKHSDAPEIIFSLPQTAPTPPQSSIAPASNSALLTPLNTIHVQILDAIQSATSNSIELRLEPEELGKLRILMTPRDGGLQVTVQADRSETLELMRRNAESLADHFAENGYENTLVDFSAYRDGSNHPETQNPDHHEHELATIEQQDSPNLTFHYGTGPLDIRL